MLKMQQKNILEATPAEIKAFAINFLGLDIDPGADDAAIFASVQQAHPGETIFVPLDDADQPVIDQAGDPPPRVEGSTQPEHGAQRQGLAGSLGRDDPKVTILIHNEERDGEVYSRDKEVGVNGRVWLLQRGKEITIPYRVFLALESAVKDSITHNKSTGEVISTKVKSVPYNAINRPSSEEIDAWHKRVDQQFCP